ncbi:MAG: hypothetical protein IID40_00005 [Planctomycetes bacterium]|nr:hypothetical protein [Planctomycetota bacterium]
MLLYGGVLLFAAMYVNKRFFFPGYSWLAVFLGAALGGAVVGVLGYLTTRRFAPQRRLVPGFCAALGCVAAMSAGPTALFQAIIAYENEAAIARLGDRNTLDQTVAETLSEVSKALRSRWKLPDPRRSGDEAQNFLDALREYVAWYGSMDESAKTGHLDYDSFRTMCKVVKDPDSFVVFDRDRVLQQADLYFRVIKREEEPTNPASLLARAGIVPRDTISQALVTVHAYFGNYARLDDTHPVPLIRHWMNVQTRCAEMQASYATLIAAADVVIETADDLNDFKFSFLESYDRFQAAAGNVVWQGVPDRSGFVRINPLADAILALRNDQWGAYAEQLKEAYRKGGTDPDIGLIVAIDTLVGGEPRGLRGVDRTLCDSLNDAGLATRAWFPNFFGDNYAQFVREIDVEYDHVITLTRAGEYTNDDKLSLAASAVTVAELLAPVAEAVRGIECETGKDAASRLPENWIARLDYLLYEVEEDQVDGGARVKLGSLDARWSPEELGLLYETYRNLLARGQGTCLLDTIERGLNDDLGEWGFAELHPDWRNGVKSNFYIDLPDAPMATMTPKSKAPKVTTGSKKQKSGRTRPSFRGGGRDREPKRDSRPRQRRDDLKPQDGAVPACATPDFLGERAMQAAQLIFYLREFGPESYFQGWDGSPPRNETLAERAAAAWQTYADAYVENWSDAYDDVKLPKLDKLMATPGGWAELAKQCRATTRTGSVGPRAISDEFQPRLSEILRATRWATYLPGEGWWTSGGGDAAQEYRDLADAISDSIQRNWEHGAFVSNAMEVGEDARRHDPWEVVSNELADRWAALCKAMYDSRKLPTDFAASSPKSYNKMRIPWGKLEELRDQARLDGEEISGQLVAFEKYAQRLLSAELTNILVGVQAKSFGDQTPVGGWPYLTDVTYAETALLTVDFKSFRLFLQKVDWARATFEPIESGLSDDDPWRADRQRFYTRCREWKEFLGLDPAGKASPLTVEIEYQDPMTDPQAQQTMDDTAQHTYANVQLDLGLRIPGDEASQGSQDRPLTIATMREEQKGLRTAIWKWPAKSGEAVLTLRFIDGLTAPQTNKRYPVIGRTLGTGSPLALCAYLEQYGRPDGDVVITSHAVNLVDEFHIQGKNDLAKLVNPAKPRVGVKLVWQLGREMPRPIVKLESADTPVSPDSED